MTKLRFKSENNNSIYHYESTGSGVFTVWNPLKDGETEENRSIATRINGSEETAIKMTNNYNVMLVSDIYESKLKELNDIYEKSNISTVTLSDGNVFSASKEIGTNPNKSLSITRKLIADAAEFAHYMGKKEIILSDANNNDVTYVLPTKGDRSYVLPVVEIAMYEMLFFELKRTIRNELMLITSKEILDNPELEVNVDSLREFKPVELFQNRIEEYRESMITK